MRSVPSPKPQRRHSHSRRAWKDRSPRRRPWRLIALVITLLAVGYVFWPKPHGWQPLGTRLGRIRWVSTRTDFLVEHPLAPGWIRWLHGVGFPWPTDLPLEPLGATFGGSGTQQTSAWYLVQSAKPTQELWHVDKESIRVIGPNGAAVEWPGGTGAVLVDSRRRLQLLYLGVPASLTGKGAHLHFRLARFNDGPGADTKTQEIDVPF
jgi:hypothetical protein